MRRMCVAVRIMAMPVIVVTVTVRRLAFILAEKRHEERARAVKRSHARREDADPIHPRSVLVRGFEDQIFTSRAG